MNHSNNLTSWNFKILNIWLNSKQVTFQLLKDPMWDPTSELCRVNDFIPNLNPAYWTEVIRSIWLKLRLKSTLEPSSSGLPMEGELSRDLIAFTRLHVWYPRCFKVFIHGFSIFSIHSILFLLARLRNQASSLKRIAPSIDSQCVWEKNRNQSSGVISIAPIGTRSFLQLSIWNVYAMPKCTNIAESLEVRLTRLGVYLSHELLNIPCPPLHKTKAAHRNSAPKDALKLQWSHSRQALTFWKGSSRLPDPRVGARRSAIG